MNKIKIFVACHKPYNVLHNNIYIPIHVGRTISKFKDEMADMIGDDTGENISERNPYYSEMTAQYWAWKNVKNTEYIGFCHYRRFFEKTFTENNIDKFFKDGTDVILVGPVLRDFGRWNTLKTFISGEDLAIMQYAVKKLYPDYYQTLSEYAYGYIDYPLNMLVCKKSLFDEYAKWIFDILFECEKHIQLSPYSRARRVFGYISEFLLPVYFIHNHYKIKPLRYTIESGHVMGGINKMGLLKMKLIDFIFWRNKKKPSLKVDYSIKAGLEAAKLLSFENLNL